MKTTSILRLSDVLTKLVTLRQEVTGIPYERSVTKDLELAGHAEPIVAALDCAIASVSTAITIRSAIKIRRD